MKSEFKQYAMVLLTFAVAACSATTIQVPRLKPAEINLGPVKKVAIGAIEGDGGEDISDKLTQAIIGTGIYEVLDRKHLAEIAREKNIQANDPGAAFGPMLGAAALVFGRITQNGYTENVTGDQQVCMAGNRQVPCTTYTRAGKHAVSVSFKIIDAASGKVLAIKLVNGVAQARRQVVVQEAMTTNRQALAGIIPPFEDVQQFQIAATDDMVKFFMRMIAPFTITVPVVLYEQDSQASKNGVTAAKAGDWATAIDAFKSALKQASASPDLEVQARAHYNIGVALGYSGSYSEGIAEIQRAISLKPDDVFQKEIENIRVFQADDAKLKAQAG